MCIVIYIYIKYILSINGEDAEVNRLDDIIIILLVHNICVKIFITIYPNSNDFFGSDIYYIILYILVRLIIYLTYNYIN